MLNIDGGKGDWNFRISDLVKNPDGTDNEFRWSPEGPVSQINSLHLHVGAPGISLRSFKVCSDAKERVGCGKPWKANAPIQSLVKLQSWFQSLRCKTCLWQNCSLGYSACSEGPALRQNTDDDDDDDIIFYFLYQCYILLFYIIVISIMVYYSLTIIQEIKGLIPGYTLEIFLEVAYRVWNGVHPASWGQLGSYLVWEVTKSG